MTDTSVEEMEKAFQQFMLGDEEINPVTENNDEIDRKNAAILRKAQNRCWSIFNLFCCIVETEWFELDNQMLDVLESKKVIRSRILKEGTILNEIAEQRNTFHYQIEAEYCLDESFLSYEDVSNTLSHDLLRHESHMKTLKKLLSNISELQERLNRILNDAMLRHFELKFCLVNDSSTKAMFLFDEMNIIFKMLSRELYRKQVLLKDMFESNNDDVLKQNDDLFETCVRTWSRVSEESCIDMAKTNNILRKSHRTK